MQDNRIMFDTTTGQPYHLNGKGERIYANTVQPAPSISDAAPVFQTAALLSEESYSTECAQKSVSYGGLFVRAAAFAVDALLAGIASSLLSLPFALLNMRNLLFSFSLHDIVGYIVFTAYFVLFTAIAGTTPGKRLFKLKVTTEDGDKPCWWNTIYRETIGRYLNSLLLIGCIFIAADPKKRGIHDRLCDTLVVYTL